MGRHIIMNWDKITPLLEAPLDQKHVRPAKKFGPKGDYIEGWHAIDEGQPSSSASAGGHTRSRPIAFSKQRAGSARIRNRAGV